MARRRKSYKEPKFANPYLTENELCNVLIDHAKNNGWKVYPETSGYDLIIVKNVQIGIQAKLKANIEVLSQAIEGRQDSSFFQAHPNLKNPEPDIRAVLVPLGFFEFYRIANALKVFVIEAVALEYNYMTMESKWIKKIITDLELYNKGYLSASKKLCWVPEIEINVPAGVKSPREITQWKVKAVKMCLKLDRKGYLTSKDFKDEKISISLWVEKKWLINTKEKDGKLHKYIRNSLLLLPDALYPEITEALNKLG